MLRLIFLAALAGFSRASDVLDYTDDDFESKIGDHGLILVEFFAPWWVFFPRFCAEYLSNLTARKSRLCKIVVGLLASDQTLAC